METNRTKFSDLPGLGKLCISSELFFGLCVGAWSIALNFHLSACGMGEAQIGVLLCMGYLVTAFTSFFVGHIGDIKGYPFVMAAGAFLMGAALLLIACVRWIPLFYLGHCMYCVGLACVMSMEFNLPLSLVREDQRQYSYNLVLVFYFIGSTIGNLMCSKFLPMFSDQKDPYKYILMICAVIFWILVALRGSMPRQAKSEQNKPVLDKQAFVEMLGKKQVRSYLLYGCLAFGLLTFSTGMLNLVLRLWHQMSDAMVGIAFSMNSILGCLILLLLPWLICRFPLHKISIAALVAQCVALGTMAFAPAAPFVCMMFLRTGACNILYTGVDSPMLQSITPDKRGTYAGMRVFANYIGMSIASVISGQLVGLGHFRLLYLACAGIALTQLLVYLFLCRPFLAQKGGPSEG